MLELDHQLFHLINSTWSHPWLDAFFPWVTDLHKSFIFQITAYPLFLIYFAFKFQKKGILLFFICALAVVTTDAFGNHMIKKQVQRLRPGDVPQIEAVVRSPYGGYSFISNHSANMACVATFISFFSLPSGMFFWLIAILIGYSRIYNGVHFPADVLVGFLVGAIFGTLFSIIAKRILEKKRTT